MLILIDSNEIYILLRYNNDRGNKLIEKQNYSKVRY